MGFFFSENDRHRPDTDIRESIESEENIGNNNNIKTVHFRQILLLTIFFVQCHGFDVAFHLIFFMSSNHTKQLFNKQWKQRK